MTTKHFARPLNSYTGEAGLVNRTKYQLDSSSTPKVPISSKKIDGDINYVVDALNTIFDAIVTGSVLDGSVTTVKLADGAVTLAKTAPLAALSVIGNATNSSATPTAITAANDGEVLVRDGTSVAFGQVATAGLGDGQVTYAKIQDVNLNRLLGRITASAGPAEEIPVTGTLSLSSTGLTAVTTPSVRSLVITNNSTTPNSKVDVTANSAVVTDSSGIGQFYSSISLTADCSTVGANGLDAGSLTTSTWYYVYLISNGSNVRGLVSTSATAPTMPSGYTYKMRIGAMRTDGSSNFLRTLQYGNKAVYQVITANLPTMASGTAGNVATPTYASISVGNFVPPTAYSIGIRMSVSSSTTMAAPNNNYGSSAASANPPFSINTTGTAMLDTNFVLEGSVIYWASQGASGRINCIGWEDNI